MGHRILLADDSLTIQKVVELTFSETEFELMAVGSGDRAVEVLDDFRPDIVLADVVMPGLTGYDVCEAVKKRPDGAAIPVILLTGTFEPFDRARAERAGCDSIVTKPFDSHALSSLVRELTAKGAEIRASLVAPPPPPPPPAPLALMPEPFTEPIGHPPTWVPPEAPAEEDVFAVSPPPAVEAAETHDLLELVPPVDGPEKVLDMPGPDEEIRDIERDMEEFEQSGKGLSRPEVWERADALGVVPRPEALPVELSPPPVELPPPPVQPVPAVPTDADRAIELEELAEQARLTDLSKLIPAAKASAPASLASLSDEDVDRVARRVVVLMGEKVVREIAWDVVPELAERMVRKRLAEIEKD